MNIRELIRHSIIEESQSLIKYSDRANQIYTKIVRTISGRNMREAEIEYNGGKTYLGFVFNLEDILGERYRELAATGDDMLDLLILSDSALKDRTASFIPNKNLIVMNTNRYLEDFTDVKDTIIRCKESLIHELIHAQVYFAAEGKNLGTYGFDTPSANIKNYTNYGNHPEEFNAFLVTAINTAIDDLDGYNHPGSYVVRFKDFYDIVKRRFQFNENLLTPENRKRFLSKIYTTWDIIKDKYVGDKYDETFADAKNKMAERYQDILDDYDETIGLMKDFYSITDEKEAFYQVLNAKSPYLQGKNRQVIIAMADKYWDKYQIDRTN